MIDVDPNVADRVSKEQGVPRFLSIQEMAAGLQGEVDGRSISVPNSLHLVTVTEALNLGLHVLVEKPMGLSISECDQMIACA